MLEINWIIYCWMMKMLIQLHVNYYAIVWYYCSSTPCPKRNSEVCFMAISQLQLGQIQKKGQFLNLLVLRFLKLSLLLIFGQVQAEIIEVNDTRGHFQFLHFYARFFPVLAVRIIFLDFQNSIWHLVIFSVILSTQMTQLLTKNTKEIDF